MSQEVMIPPWVRPESPETIRIIDDATVAFNPAFGRGMTQRGIFADPRWGLRRRYRGLRSDEKAAILSVLNESRGQFNRIRVTPHAPIRGSFATSELVANNSFTSGTTGWSDDSKSTISVSDRVLNWLRDEWSGGNSSVGTSAASTVVAYAPYVARAMIRAGRNAARTMTVGFGASSLSDSLSQSSAATDGLIWATYVSSITSLYLTLSDTTGTGGLAGDYAQVTYTSLTRCALVDNGTNLLILSDDLGNSGGGSGWSTTGLSTVSENTSVAPDGTSTADSPTENSSTSEHYIQENATVSSSAVDLAFSVALKAGSRSFAALTLVEATSSTSAQVFFNLSTGAAGTINTGANWSAIRAFVTPLGSGWYQCTLVARKTNAATTVRARIQIASADGTSSYLGNGSGAIAAWRATLALSSVPVRLTFTGATASTGTTQTGGGLHTKGWPASTNGLLLTGDWFEWQGELKQLTVPVNSNSSGLAYMQFRPGLAGTPADNDPIIVYEPFGRFLYAGTREFENLFGIYGDCEMNLEEVYS